MLTLVLGTGGREHAIAWKLSQTQGLSRVILHPGNAGTERLGLPTLGEEVDWKDVEAVASKAEALAFADRVWKSQEFGPGPHRVVIEGFLHGVEVSYLGFCDGKRFVPLATATDYKRVGDGDTGPNTGGMGAVSPSPHFTSELQ